MIKLDSGWPTITLMGGCFCLFSFDYKLKNSTGHLQPRAKVKVLYFFVSVDLLTVIKKGRVILI